MQHAPTCTFFQCLKNCESMSTDMESESPQQAHLCQRLTGQSLLGTFFGQVCESSGSSDIKYLSDKTGLL